jgi:hypothetical protein
MSNAVPLLILDALIVVVAFAWPRSRQIMKRWVRFYVETPLRQITGRRRPDYRRIAELERTELT